jgi:hypothetical protein
MGKYSSDKGKTFEREVAKYFSTTYDDYFIRVPRSGAYVGGKNAARKESMTEGQIRSSKGDIIPPDHWTTFNCECKWYKDFSFHLLFSGEYALADDWIREVRESQEPNDLNLILIKINYKGQYVMYEDNTPMVVEPKINYKGWYFCSWDKFWTESNTELVRQLSSN